MSSPSSLVQLYRLSQSSETLEAAGTHNHRWAMIPSILFSKSLTGPLKWDAPNFQSMLDILGDLAAIPNDND